MIADVHHMKSVDVQSSHIVPVASAFLSVVSPLNIVRMFAIAGLVLPLTSDGKLFCRACPQHARWLFKPIERVAEPVPMDHEVEQIENGIHFERRAEIIIPHFLRRAAHIMRLIAP
jgi:hypothetical protein